MPFVTVQDEIELYEGKNTVKFDIFIPGYSNDIVYTVNFIVMQKDIVRTGGITIIENALKIFKITPVFPENDNTITARIFVDEVPAVPIIPAAEKNTSKPYSSGGGGGRTGVDTGQSIMNKIPRVESISIEPETMSPGGKKFDSPLKQMRNGILAENVQCNDDRELYIRNSIDPLCLKDGSYEKLKEYGLDITNPRTLLNR